MNPLLLCLLLAFPLAAQEQGAIARPGEPFPPFALTDAQDAPFSSEQLVGQPAVLYFTHNMCHYCSQIIGFLMQAQDRGYETRGLRIVTINVWARDQQLIRRYRDRFGFSFPMLAGNNKDLLKAYEVNYVPIVVFIGRDGRIRRIFHHFISKEDFFMSLEEITGP
jgi:peroxiredoxin